MPTIRTLLARRPREFDLYRVGKYTTDRFGFERWRFPFARQHYNSLRLGRWRLAFITGTSLSV